MSLPIVAPTPTAKAAPSITFTVITDDCSAELIACLRIDVLKCTCMMPAEGPTPSHDMACCEPAAMPRRAKERLTPDSSREAPKSQTTRAAQFFASGRSRNVTLDASIAQLQPHNLGTSSGRRLSEALPAPAPAPARCCNGPSQIPLTGYKLVCNERSSPSWLLRLIVSPVGLF